MKTIGFPRMHKEENERRDFLPIFFRQFKACEVEIYLEEGYGSSMGIPMEEYLIQNSCIKFVTNRECYEKDIVVVLRCPEVYELDYMKEGSILVSMLHYPTRKTRVEYLKKRNIFGVSLDMVRNDLMERIVVDYKGTSGNGIETAFSQLYKELNRHKEFKNRPVKVSIIGMGMVGLMAAKASGKFGNHIIAERFRQHKMDSVIVNMLPRNLTCCRKKMISSIEDADILVDATNRDNASDYIIDNELIKYLKEHAIILDLSADPYLEDTFPIQVKAIEGIPTGTLDKFVFYPDDEAYNYIPKTVTTANRRLVVSCNAWPGVKPLECMNLYGIQMQPIMKRLIQRSSNDFDENDDDFFARAIYRSTIEYYESAQSELNMEIS